MKPERYPIRHLAVGEHTIFKVPIPSPEHQVQAQAEVLRIAAAAYQRRRSGQKFKSKATLEAGGYLVTVWREA